MNHNILEKLHKYRGKPCQQPYSHRLTGVYKKRKEKALASSFTSSLPESTL